MKKTVVLSTNDNPDYLNYLPYTIAAWNKLGWSTFTFLIDGASVPDVGTDTDEIKNSFCVSHGMDVESLKKETVSQVIRLFAGHFVNDGIVMTGDVDLIPMANYWHPTIDNITVYGHDLTGRSQYPICYIAMSAERWREIIPEKSLAELLAKYPNAKSDDFYKWWGVDQEIITDRINKDAYCNPDGSAKLILIDRGFTNGLAKGRIDRADWERTINSPDQKIDAHMLRPFNLEQTERVMKLVTL